MKFVSPIQNRQTPANPTVKTGPSPQETFSTIFASELRSLSNAQSPSSASKNINASPVQNAERVAKTSFSRIFPNLSAPVIERTAQNSGAPSAASAGRIVPGIVNMPMPQAPAVVKPVKDSAAQKTGSIDIARIINFSRPGPKTASPAAKGSAIVTTGGNPSVVVTSRSQAPATEWDRYRMESSPQGRMGGILGSGVMVAFRIEIG